MNDHKHLVQEARSNDLKQEASNTLQYKDQVAGATSTTNTFGVPFALAEQIDTSTTAAATTTADGLVVPLASVENDELDALRQQVKHIQQQQEREQQEQRERWVKVKKGGLCLLAGLLLMGAIVAGVCGSGNCSSTAATFPPPGSATTTTTTTTTLVFKSFASPQELRNAVDEYILAENSQDSTAASTFGYPIGSWDVSKITSFAGLFSCELRGCDSPLGVAIAAFNGDILNWNVGQVTDMSNMFESSNGFNGDISTWNVGQVADMSEMFRDADAFNGDISNWNVRQVTDMSGLFLGGDAFRQNLCSWRSRLPVDCNVANMFLFASGCSGDNTPTLPDGPSMCQVCQEA